jgi:hypothetical protein
MAFILAHEVSLKMLGAKRQVSKFLGFGGEIHGEGKSC